MYLPQVAEVDVYDVNGIQVDDINSLYEYVDEVLLHNVDATPDDEDDDNGQIFQEIKFVEYVFQQGYLPLAHPVDKESISTFYCKQCSTKLSSVSFDINTPPPELSLF